MYSCLKNDPGDEVSSLHVVITGGRGFIATALRTKLRDQGHTVTTTDRQDASNIRAVLASLSPSIVIHAAAELSDETAMFDSNVVLTRDILEHCKAVSPACRLVLLGSSSEYGRVGRATSETDALQPGTLYEATKAASAMLTQGYATTYGFQASIIRPYSVYGAGEKPHRFVRFLMTKPAAIDLCPSPVHDFIYIDDFLEGVCAVLHRQTKLFDVVNLGSGVQTTNADLVRTVESVLQYKFEIRATLQPKPNDAQTWVCDPTYAWQVYGFKATTTLKQGLKRMADALKIC